MKWVGLSLAAGLMLVAGCHSSPAVNGGAAATPPAASVAAAVTSMPPAPTTTGTLAAAPTDAELWRLSRDPATVAAGQKLFTLSACRTCHGPTLTGGAAPNLVDQLWLHGGRPSEVFQTIVRGVPSKGMPTWGPALDATVITQIVAFIFSHHHEGEPIVKQESFTPFTPVY
jgi:mono/diheme cytochrome c family protein